MTRLKHSVSLEHSDARRFLTADGILSHTPTVSHRSVRLSRVFITLSTLRGGATTNNDIPTVKMEWNRLIMKGVEVMIELMVGNSYRRITIPLLTSTEVPSWHTQLPVLNIKTQGTKTLMKIGSGGGGGGRGLTTKTQVGLWPRKRCYMQKLTNHRPPLQPSQCTWRRMTPTTHPMRPPLQSSHACGGGRPPHTSHEATPSHPCNQANAWEGEVVAA